MTKWRKWAPAYVAIGVSALIVGYPVITDHNHKWCGLVATLVSGILFAGMVHLVYSRQQTRTPILVLSILASFAAPMAFALCFEQIRSYWWILLGLFFSLLCCLVYTRVRKQNDDN